MLLRTETGDGVLYVCIHGPVLLTMKTSDNLNKQSNLLQNFVTITYCAVVTEQIS